MEKRILNAAELTSHGNVEGRKAIVEILEAGLEATDPYTNTLKLINISGKKLVVGCKKYVPSGSPRAEKENVDLNQVDRIFVIGAGKGIQNVAKALEDNAVSEEEYKQIFAAYEDLMKEVDEFTVSVKGMIDAYRELFGVVLSVFRDKFGK